MLNHSYKRREVQLGPPLQICSSCGEQGIFSRNGRHIREDGPDFRAAHMVCRKTNGAIKLLVYLGWKNVLHHKPPVTVTKKKAFAEQKTGRDSSSYPLALQSPDVSLLIHAHA